MEIPTEYKIILTLVIFLIIWMSLSFKNVFCEGRVGFGLCYKKAAPVCPVCQTCPTARTGQIGSKAPAPFLA
jgi:hypothetical protein